MCALNISNYFWRICYYYDHKRETNFEQNSSLEPVIRNLKSIYWNLDFFLTTSSVVGGGDFGAMVLEMRRGSPSASSAAWCMPPTDSKHMWNPKYFTLLCHPFEYLLEDPHSNCSQELPRCFLLYILVVNTISSWMHTWEYGY